MSGSWGFGLVLGVRKDSREVFGHDGGRFRV